MSLRLKFTHESCIQTYVLAKPDCPPHLVLPTEPYPRVQGSHGVIQQLCLSKTQIPVQETPCQINRVPKHTRRSQCRAAGPGRTGPGKKGRADNKVSNKGLISDDSITHCLRECAVKETLETLRNHWVTSINQRLQSVRFPIRLM